MSTLNPTPDHTGITQDLKKIIDAVRAANPEKQEAMKAKVSNMNTSVQQTVATTIAPVITPATPADTAATPSQQKLLPPELQQALLSALESRFETNKNLHPETNWTDVEKALNASPETIWSLQQLELTGGEPDIFLDESDAFVFGDCSAESPSGRRNMVFDKQAEKWLRKNVPQAVFNGNAADKVTEWGVDFMDEPQYRGLQKLKTLDRNTWSWLKTPAHIRQSGSALYGYRNLLVVRVNRSNASDRSDSGGFRCALRVNKV